MKVFFHKGKCSFIKEKWTLLVIVLQPFGITLERFVKERGPFAFPFLTLSNTAGLSTVLFSFSGGFLFQFFGNKMSFDNYKQRGQFFKEEK